MTDIKTLEEWNAKFGGDEGFNPFSQQAGFDWIYDVAYPVKIKKAYRSTRQDGGEQVKMIIEVQENEGEDAKVLAEVTEWVDIPYQGELDKKMVRETREKVTRMRFDTLKRIWSAALPHDFAPYHRVEADPARPGKKIFFDFDGSPLIDGKYDERGMAINERMMQKVDWLKSNPDAEIEELAEVLLYISKKRNPKNEQFPYTNYYSTQPTKIPLFGADGGLPG